jgi:hypothetical protein
MPRALSSVAAACALFGQRVTAHTPNIPEHEHSREQDKMEKLHMVRASRARFLASGKAAGSPQARAAGLWGWSESSLLTLSLLSFFNWLLGWPIHLWLPLCVRAVGGTWLLANNALHAYLIC